ncbi:MAG: endonuclease MutS2 [Armatimonadia bacterium]|nr:endonuclease MutS2 [Armatimonadia bacterium]
MDSRTLTKIELDEIRVALASECSCSLGRERAESLQPETDAQVIADRLAETSEARRMVDEEGPLPLGGVTDIRELIKRSRVGSALSGSELLKVGDCLRGMRRARAAIESTHPDDYPLLRDLADHLGVHTELEGVIEDTVGPEGEVVDTASPELRRLRSRLGVLRSRIDQTMRDFLNRESEGSKLQDRLVTTRRGRPCVPVKAGSKGSIQGVVHDVSSSGQTVFVEPQGVVRLGDELQQVLAAEQEEVSRILREVSGKVGEVAEEVQHSVTAIAILDFVFARGSLSRRMDASRPEISTEGHVHLKRARHPLIDPSEVVPIDVWVGEEFTVLLITGPNTGGKTVALKTVGLLCAMAQSGLHVPADMGSSVPVLQDIYADIGDEQSIAQSLSTFSSHMSNIARICKRAREGTLVLLDEIGAGTDPGEGAALAQAILRYLRDRGCLVLTTTHYNALKVFALSEPGMMNASVEFDHETLAPTYRLMIGVPGSSNAMNVASRLGLRTEILMEAKELIGDDAQRVERVVSDLERSRRRFEREKADLSQAKTSAEEELDRLHEERERIREERDRIRKETAADAKAILRKAREEAQEILREIRQQNREGRATQEARDRLETLDAEVREQLGDAPEPDEPAEAQPPEPPPAAIHEGDTVELHNLSDKRAVVIDPDRGDGRIRVSAGGLQMDVDLEDVTVLETTGDRQVRDQVGAIKVRKALSVPSEIDLRGLTVTEAIDQVDKLLDDAALAEHEEVRLIHGKGTGALKQGLRRHLSDLPIVKGMRDAPLNAGGLGVTIVDL